jgi:hypothetical protein
MKLLNQLARQRFVGCTFCKVKKKLDKINIIIDSIGMEETQRNYSKEDEIRMMDFHLGIEGTKSNGHGEERNENMNMAETITNLQKDVQGHKYVNESIMKYKEKKDDFNMKLL